MKRKPKALLPNLNNESRVERIIFNGTALLFLFVLLLAFLFASCGVSKPISYPRQNIPELEDIEIGTKFSLLDSEGKRTEVLKESDGTFLITTEQEKPKPQTGSLINIHVQKDKRKTYTDSYNKDKSRTNTADNGAVIGKDKSDNKGATDSGNKEVSNSFPWYVWVILALGIVGFIYFKFLTPINKLK